MFCAPEYNPKLSKVGDNCGITYGTGLYSIVGGVNGKVAWSEDVKTFTDSEILGSIGTFIKVVYGNGYFVTFFVGINSGVICYSNNGKSFNNSKFPDDMFNDIAFGNDVFVIVGNNYISYSKYGDVFNISNVSGEYYNIPYNCIIYEGGYFVVVGDKGTVAYSQNGTEFTRIQIEEAKNINFSKVAYDFGKNRYIVTAENDISTIYYLTFEENYYLNTGFKVLTNGEPDETIKIYKQ